jgi:hypothetical protein
MRHEPKVYIAVEDEAGQLIVHGPLKLFDRLVTTLTGQSSQPAPVAVPLPERATEPQKMASTEADHV